MKDLDFLDHLLPMDDNDLKELQQRALRMKTDILMEEPCPIYEADEEDWEDFWYGEEA
jgi:hypothetical protein